LSKNSKIFRSVKESRLIEILLINDDEDDAFILHEVAQLFAHQLILEDVGAQQLIFEKLQPDNLPDVIFLDLYMGKQNGVDVLKQIRSKKHLKNIPVIIYSTRQHSSIVRKCFDLGATLFVEKPHTYKGVERMLKKLVAMDWTKYKTKSK
jgi:response regulator RpfG family c-di-GMP phosphodiesterase